MTINVIKILPLFGALSDDDKYYGGMTCLDQEIIKISNLIQVKPRIAAFVRKPNLSETETYPKAEFDPKAEFVRIPNVPKCQWQRTTWFLNIFGVSDDDKYYGGIMSRPRNYKNFEFDSEGE